MIEVARVPKRLNRICYFTRAPFLISTHTPFRPPLVPEHPPTPPSPLILSRPAPGVNHRMPSLARSRLVRDVLLVFLGAISMHFITTLLHPFDDIYPTWTLQSFHQEEFVIDPPPYDGGASGHRGDKNYYPVLDDGNERGGDPSSPPAGTAITPVEGFTTIPETEMVQHAPGWTVFKNLYMSNGTFYVVSDKPRSEFPELVYILSVPIPALNTPENIQARIPTDREMDFIGTQEALRRWGPLRPGEKNRVWSVAGNTVCIPCLNPLLNFPSLTPPGFFIGRRVIVYRISFQFLFCGLEFD